MRVCWTWTSGPSMRPSRRRKRGECKGATKCRINNKIEMLSNGQGIPLLVVVDAANTPETRMSLTVVTRTLSLLPRGVRTPVLADKAYDDC